MIKRRPEVMRCITHDEGDAVRDCGHVLDSVVPPPCQWGARYLNLAGVGAPESTNLGLKIISMHASPADL
jgi:hypothetical protein